MWAPSTTSRLSEPITDGIGIIAGDTLSQTPHIACPYAAKNCLLPTVRRPAPSATLR